MMDKKIGLIGAGNVAYFLLEKLPNTCQLFVWNRQLAHSSAIRQVYNHVEVVPDFNAFKEQVDVIIIAVSDDSIQAVLASCQDVSDKIFLHSSGSVTIENHLDFKNTGVIWPLYSIIKDQIQTYNNIPIIYNGSNAHTTETAKSIAEFITDVSYPLDEQQRSVAHLIAVMSNNFMNHILSQCQFIAEKERLDFRMFLPIIFQTTDQITHSSSISNLQTGPARRQDMKTIERHLNLIQNNKNLTEIYKSISQSIINQYTKNE